MRLSIPWNRPYDMLVLFDIYIYKTYNMCSFSGTNGRFWILRGRSVNIRGYFGSRVTLPKFS